MWANVVIGVVFPLGFVTFLVLTTERTGSSSLLIASGIAEKNLSGFDIVPANLAGARISDPPESYVQRFLWVREFAASYQQKDGNGFIFKRPVFSFEDEWFDRRRSYIAGITKPDLLGSDFQRADLRDAYLVGVNAKDANFDFANLERAEMEGINAARSSFRNVILKSAHIEDGHFENAIFSNAKMDRVFMQESFLRCTEFLEKTVLFEAKMDGSFLDEARFERADLRRASLRGVYFKRMDLGSSDMEGANLAGAIIWHSDLSKVRNLTVQQLENVLIDQESKLPDYLPADFKRKQCWDKMQKPPFPYRQPWWTYSDPVISRAICGRNPVPLPDTANCAPD